MKRNIFMTGCILVLGLWFVLWFYLSSSTPNIRGLKDPFKVPEIVFVNFPEYYELANAQSEWLFRDCDRPCKLSVDKNRAASADAQVIFSHEHIMVPYTLDVKTKSHGQLWVFFAVESPPFAGHAILAGREFNNMFDLMMTYRRDSDLFFGYMKTSPRESPVTQEGREADLKSIKETYRKKKKMVAWFVSNCKTQSKRENYVDKLKNYIQVDTFGKCGDFQCENREQCNKMVSDNYMFYLAFENTLCEDYLSEKLYKILSERKTVPVVRGGADYEALCPPDSVVNTADFKSPKELAEYLKKLASNETAYTKKLQWGWDYEVKGPTMPWCELCDVISKSVRDGIPTKSPYPSAVKWWSHNKCHRPKDL